MGRWDGALRLEVVVSLRDGQDQAAVGHRCQGGQRAGFVDRLPRRQQIKTIAQPAGNIASAGRYAITDDALLVSPDVDLLKQALDVKAGQPALADDAFFTQQLGALHADRLATVYFDANKQVSAMPLPSDLPLPTDCMQASQAVAKVKYVGEVRAESDHFAFTIRSQVATGDGVPPAPANKQTTLAQAMPADTMVYLEARNAGASVDSLIKKGLACMSDQTWRRTTAQRPGRVGQLEPALQFRAGNESGELPGLR